MKSYILKSSGKSRISAALAQLCSEGEVGELLLRNGVSQEAFCLFLARLASLHFAAGKDAEHVAAVFSLVSGGNTSAAQKALADVSIHWEETDAEGCSILDKDGAPTFAKSAQSVSAYWTKDGGSKSVANLSLLKL